ncbi:MAG: hydroxyacid dehydrogenase [Clostridia bacterium]|nr:hydroxyacid dehydrogenase [Clostridia bacterium]
MKIAILDKGTLGADINLTPLRSLGETAEYESTSPENVAERIAAADVAVINKVKLNGTNLPAAKNLKLICVAATGYDNIDTAYCRENGIALCNVPGYSTESVAQLTLAMALSLSTNLTQYRDFTHSGAYTNSGVANKVSPVFHEISSMTWGVVGGGGIGARVASVAKALGCRVIVCRRKKEEVYEQMELDELCECADIISLHVPLTEETRGMINRELIAKMKKGAILINVARGAVADEAALAEAVESGHLGGLGIDVYSSEPFPANHPFTRILSYKNVCLTPHMAWGAYESRNRCIEEIGKNISAFFAGENRNRIV